MIFGLTGLVGLLVYLLILVLIFWLLYWLISNIPLPAPLAPIRWIAYCILIIIAIVVLLGFLPGVHLGA